MKITTYKRIERRVDLKMNLDSNHFLEVMMTIIKYNFRSVELMKYAQTNLNIHIKLK
jgi:hypothetical protein